jgi:hypothetical protein
MTFDDMTTSDWQGIALRWIESHPPPYRAPAGSRSPRSKRESDEWWRWTKELHEAGLATAHWPRAWGGGGATPQESRSIVEVLCAAGAPIALSDIGVSMVGPAIARAGSDAQREQHLAPIVAGTTGWTQLFSEPDAGSDLASLRTAARRVDGGWRIQGQKIWSTYAHIAEWGFLLARTESGEERHRAISVFLVPMKSEGITVRPIREITGDSDFNEVFFDDVFVDDDALLGAPGEGWKIAMDLLAEERSVTGRNIIGLRSELDRIASLSSPDPSTTSLIDSQLGRLCAASSAILASIVAARPGREPLAKVAFSELNIEVHQFALDILAQGIDVSESWSERWSDNYWNARAYTISGGSNEVLRNVVAKRMLGLTPEATSATLAPIAGDDSSLERDALRGLFESNPEPAMAWTSLVRDGWLDLLPGPLGNWDLVRSAITAVQVVAEQEHPVAYLGHLAANATLADIGLPLAHASSVATDASESGEHVAAILWGPVGNVTECVLGPLNGGLYLVELVNCDSHGAVAFDRGGTLARRLTTTKDSLQLLTADSELIERHQRRLALLLAADALGAAERSFQMARGYVSDRRQFGATLASNQAIQHRLADMFSAVSILRDILNASVEEFDEQGGDHLVWSAKCVAGERAVWTAEQAIQLHGGNGFTWEFGLHWSLARAQRTRLLLGGSSASNERVVRTYRERHRPHLTDWSQR